MNKNNISKEQWFSEALNVLQSGGIESVRVERLAARLNTSRSGFYWHFENREDLLISLLKYWTKEYTEVVTIGLTESESDPLKRLYLTTDMVRKHKLAKYDLPIRTWALSDPLAKKAVAKVNNIRVNYSRSMFSELGFSGEDLEMRARLFACYVTWEIPMYGLIPNKRWVEQRNLWIHMLTVR